MQIFAMLNLCLKLEKGCDTYEYLRDIENSFQVYIKFIHDQVDVYFWNL